MNGDGWFGFDHLAGTAGGFLIGCLVTGIVSGWIRRNYEQLLKSFENRITAKIHTVEETLQEHFAHLHSLIQRSQRAEKKADLYTTKLLQFKLSANEAHTAIQACKDSAFDSLQVIRNSSSSLSFDKTTTDFVITHDLHEAENKLRSVEENLMHLAGRMENADQLLTRFHEPFDWLNALSPERLGALLYH